MAGRFSSSYLRTTCRIPCGGASLTVTSRTKPSSRSTSHTFSFSFEAGRSSSSSPARCALRMRVNKSATGSVMLICYAPRLAVPVGTPTRLCLRPEARGLPRRLDHSGDLAFQRPVPEADPAHLELVEERPAAAAEPAPVVRPHLELRLQCQALRLRDLGELGHDYAVLKGMPMYLRRARPSSSLFAVVTMVTFMPLIFSILS